jgi:hypothetical protein
VNAIAFNMVALLCDRSHPPVAPVTSANIRIGTMVGLKGFAAGILGA